MICAMSLIADPATHGRLAKVVVLFDIGRRVKPAAR